eukprot:7101873-Heterocapsa_arctica.AAC.1
MLSCSASRSRDDHLNVHLPKERVHRVSSSSRRHSNRSRRRSRSSIAPPLRHSAVGPPPGCSVCEYN